MLERIFHLKENLTSPSTEIRAGLVTFITMSYIIFVQPGMLSAAGMDFGAVMVATCISAALASLIMGLYANYPICQAPLMGENAFFAFTVVLGMGVSWQTALGAVFISGVIFLLLTFFRVRELIIDAVPDALKYSIAGGIGLFIAFIGLQQAGLVARNDATLVALGDIRTPWALVALIGLFIIGALLVRKIKGAILWGLLATTGIAILFGVAHFKPADNFIGHVVSLPPSLAPTFLKLDLAGALNPALLPVVLVFLVMLLFDTVGTLIGVSAQAGLLGEDGKLPRAGKALLSDAVATTAGSLLGTSTVSSYIESASGVAEGGRTGLTAVTAAILFILALFFSPLVVLIGGGHTVGEGAAAHTFYPITAPIMIIVGVFMIQNIRKIKWTEFSDALPAFLTMVGMPLTYSIADGLAFGFISYPIIKLLGGKGGEVSWLVYLLGILMLARYIFIKLG